LKGLKVLSLCGGIETGLLTLTELGIPIDEYHTYEILPEAIAVSSYHFPYIIHHGDLIGADFSRFKGFDLILAGTCCQSLSRTRIDNEHITSGLDGKSGIFYEAVRALEEINPKWFMFENVIPSNVDDLYEMNRCLGVEGQLINSNMFWCQDRERYYWKNFDIPELPKTNAMIFRDIMEHEVDGKYFYKKDFTIIAPDKKVCGTLNVNTNEMCKRIYNPDFKMATLTCVQGGYQEKKILDNGKPRKLTELEYERNQGLPDGYTDVVVNNKRLPYSKRCSLCGNGWNKPTVKHILSGLKQYL
jgi:site-specific DNA-cytosine methylase